MVTHFQVYRFGLDGPLNQPCAACLTCRYQQLQPASPQVTLQELSLAALARSSMLTTANSTATAQPEPAVQSESASAGGPAGQPDIASASGATAMAVPDCQHSVSTVSTALLPGCSAHTLAVWFELKAGSAVISTGPPSATTGSAQASTAETTADDTGAKDQDTAGRQQLPCGWKPHSTGMGLGLYHLDSPIAGHAMQHAATSKVLLTTRHSPAAVRLLFEVSVLQEDTQGTTAANAAATTGSSQHRTASSGTGGSIGSIASSSSSSSKSQQSPSGPARLVTSQQISWHPHGFPHHSWLPRWHFDMLADATRNNAYEAALR